MNVDCFDPHNVLVEDKNGKVQIPDAVNFNDFKQWINNLENIETPIWAGLPASADDLLRIQRLEHIIVNLQKL